MAGYQTIEALRPILHKGPPATPVLDRMLFYKPRTKASPSLDEIARAVAWRKEGMSTRAIAKKLGYAASTFKRYIKDIPPPPGGWSNGSRKSRVTAAQIAKAERMARAGFTWIEIAEDLGCAKSTIRTAVGRDKRHRTRETDLSKVVRAVRDVTGIPAALLRSDCESSAKVPARIARARHIVFWMAHHQFGIATAAIAEKLGGFNGRTVSRGVAKANRVAEQLDLTGGMRRGTVARLMWQAEWPKASV